MERFLTPQATDGMRSNFSLKSIAKRFAKHPNGNLAEQIAYKESTASGGALNPEWVEWLMGWTIAWTDLGASATVKSPYAPQPQ